MKQKIYIIDGYNFIYRLFFTVPSFTLKDGTPVNTVFWLAKMVLSWQEQDRPDKLIFVVDSKWKNYRHDIYENYKATRDRMPTDLKTQESLIFELLEKFGINPISKMWFETDDIIWTLVEKLRWDKERDEEKRKKFQQELEQIKILQTETRKGSIIYVDESWIDHNEIKSKSWSPIWNPILSEQYGYRYKRTTLLAWVRWDMIIAPMRFSCYDTTG